jgi:DNA-binding LytR/AlgR family response regulator
MPVINGINFFRQLPSKPICVFITAHSEYASEGFDVHALDFILKPVREERFASCVTRVQEYLELLKRSDLYNSQIVESTIVIKEGTDKHVININEILYIEALKDYSKIVTLHKKFMTLSNLKQFMDQLPPDKFIRIHRSYAVALSKVNKVAMNELYIQNIRLPIGKTYKNILKAIL